MATLSARALGHRCTIIRATMETDLQGGWVPTWATVAAGVECRLVQPSRLAAVMSEGRDVAEPSSELYVRPNADLREGDRVNVSGALYDVHGVLTMPEAGYRKAMVRRRIDA